MSNYIMGRRLEYRIRDIFRREGYLVIRAASSKPIDLVCIKNGKTVLVECKAGRSWLGKGRKVEPIRLCEEAGAPILLGRGERRKVELTILPDRKIIEEKGLFS